MSLVLAFLIMVLGVVLFYVLPAAEICTRNLDTEHRRFTRTELGQPDG